ncbi:hypothetical protein CDIK_4015 [Cucumispora dikerogammari]|nr:hypothetical protein CDIK_4015 [Cucumispora dikerogammari]
MNSTLSIIITELFFIFSSFFKNVFKDSIKFDVLYGTSWLRNKKHSLLIAQQQDIFLNLRPGTTVDRVHTLEQPFIVRIITLNPTSSKKYIFFLLSSVSMRKTSFAYESLLSIASSSFIRAGIKETQLYDQLLSKMVLSIVFIETSMLN